MVDISHTNEYEVLHVDRIADRPGRLSKVQDGCNQFAATALSPTPEAGCVPADRSEVLEEVRTWPLRAIRKWCSRAST